MENFLVFFSTLFGLLVGSFLNALIYRLPRNINIAFPRSSCTNCQKIISWYENIPVLSFVFLKGKCSNCGSKISIQYPIIEILSGIVAMLIAPKTIDPNDLFSFIFFFSVYCAFLVHFIVDLKHQILPDSINIYLGLIFFLVSFVSNSWSHWLMGALFGFGFPMAVSWIFYKLRGQIGLGGGDIKLYGVLGIYLGPVAIMQNIFFSCFLGAFVGLSLMAFKIIKKENPIPFGPFIIIVGSAQIFAGEWFNSLMRYIS